ncbi:MAG TPA: hypothetical protein VN771_03070 [Candidatus Baltobacteraceae bacterium]|nr:hypothetical protein [Candidatus Baltobacteraceae bacterium]
MPRTSVKASRSTGSVIRDYSSAALAHTRVRFAIPKRRATPEAAAGRLARLAASGS